MWSYTCDVQGGFPVKIESGAGDNAQFPDALYEAVGKSKHSRGRRRGRGNERRNEKGERDLEIKLKADSKIERDVMIELDRQKEERLRNEVENMQQCTARK